MEKGRRDKRRLAELLKRKNTARNIQFAEKIKEEGGSRTAIGSRFEGKRPGELHLVLPSSFFASPRHVFGGKGKKGRKKSRFLGIRLKREEKKARFAPPRALLIHYSPRGRMGEEKKKGLALMTQKRRPGPGHLLKPSVGLRH